jgi:hypothetical protein
VSLFIFTFVAGITPGPNNMMLMASGFTGLICMAVWLKLGHSLRVLLQTEKRIKYFNISMAVLLIFSIIPIAFVTAEICFLCIKLYGQIERADFLGMALTSIRKATTNPFWASTLPNNTCQSDSLFRGFFYAFRYASIKCHSTNCRCVMQ